jgi:RNA polymerase sigma-70 factor, ECF subfamily
MSIEQSLPTGSDQEGPFASCYARLYERFKRYGWAELRDPASAEDVVQSTLVAIWQRHFLGAGSRYVEVDPLAFRMLKLRVSNLNRDRPRRAKPMTRLGAWATRAQRWMLPDALRRRPLLGDVVDTALDDMRPRCREVFLLRREAAMSFKEIAALSGTGTRTVSALMHRAQYVLRDHVARAGFGTAARRDAVDSARWKIAEFHSQPDLYESQEAIIERDQNPDSALLSDYIAGELPAESMADVAGRLERDAEFRELAEPLLMAWSVPPRSKPVTQQELLRSWLQVRESAGLPPLPGQSPIDGSPRAAGSLRQEIEALMAAATTRGGPALEVLEVGGDAQSPWVRGRSTVRTARASTATEFVWILKRGADGRLTVYVDTRG